MIPKNKFFHLFLIVAFVSINSIAGLQNDTTTTAAPNTTTTTTVPVTTTTEPPTTTTPAPTDKIFNFTLPKNTSSPACLRLKFSLAFDITYVAEFNNTKSNSTVNVKLDDYKDYDGFCNETIDTFSLMFDINKNEWSLNMKYILKGKNEYELDSFSLKYVADPALFTNITKDDAGKTFEASASGLGQFAASEGNSFKCTAETKFAINSNLSVEFRNYQGQPFIKKDSKDFDTAIECSADTQNTGKLVPIIVGSTLAVLVILVLIAYIIGRQKHRNGYQTV